MVGESLGVGACFLCGKVRAAVLGSLSLSFDLQLSRVGV